MKWLAVFPLRLYQRFFSPLLPHSCRFSPSCSQYMIEAVQKKGLLRGVFMGCKRIARCHPFGGGGHDPVEKAD